MSTNTALDQIKNRVEGLSDLCPEYMHLAIRNSVRNCDFDCQAHGEEEDCGPGQSDGARIAHSLADVPKLLAALEAVQALHRKVPVYVTPAGDCEHGADCESVEIDGESMCPDETEGYTCDHCAELNPDEYPDYPCSTIKAIEEALR